MGHGLGSPLSRCIGYGEGIGVLERLDEYLLLEGPSTRISRGCDAFWCLEILMRVRQWSALWNSSCLRSGPFGGPLGTVLILSFVTRDLRFSLERRGIDLMFKSAGVTKCARSLCESAAVLDLAICEGRHSGNWSSCLTQGIMMYCYCVHSRLKIVICEDTR